MSFFQTASLPSHLQKLPGPCLAPPDFCMACGLPDPTLALTLSAPPILISCCPLNLPDTFLPQDLCTYSALRLESQTSPHGPMAPLLPLPGLIQILPSFSEVQTNRNQVPTPFLASFISPWHWLPLGTLLARGLTPCCGAYPPRAGPRGLRCSLLKLQHFSHNLCFGNTVSEANALERPCLEASETAHLARCWPSMHDVLGSIPGTA